MRFTAIKNFYSEETGSEYVAGLSYQAQPQDKLLLELIQQWIADGLIREGGPQAIVSGKE